MTTHEAKIPYAPIGVLLLVLSIILAIIGGSMGIPFFAKKGSTESHSDHSGADTQHESADSHPDRSIASDTAEHENQKTRGARSRHLSRRFQWLFRSSEFF